MSTFQRGDPEERDDGQGEQVFRSFFQNANDDVASTILAGRVAHMTESIEDEQRHNELFKDLEEHIHNNYVTAPREEYNP